MKKHFLLILLSAFLICSTIIFAGCDNTPDNTDENGGGTTETPSGDNTNTGDTSKLSLTTNIENCTIEDDKINITVSNDTKSFSFINAFNTPENYKWELHYDKACLPSLNVVSKSVDLDEGDNVLYALFVNKENSEEIYLYEILIHRIYNADLKYYVVSPNGSKTFVKSENIVTKQDYALTYIPNDSFWDVGHIFSHYENNAGDKITSINISTSTDVLIVQKANSYTITLDVNGGTSLDKSKITVTYGAFYELPTPQKVDCLFEGWYSDDNDFITNSGTWNIANNITLKAHWANEYITYTGSSGDEFLNSLFKTTPTTKNEIEANNETQTTYSVEFEFDPTLSSAVNEAKEWDFEIELVISVFVQYYDIRGQYQTCNLTFYVLRGAIGSDHFYKYSYNLGYFVTPSSMQILLQQEKGIGCTLIGYETSRFSYTYKISGTITYK